MKWAIALDIGAMEIPLKKKRRYPYLKSTAVVIAAVSLLGFAWIRAKGYAESTFVDLEKLVVAEVKRGDLIREVRAPGTLVPVQLNYVTATSSGRVGQILLEAGEVVAEDTIIMRLINPELAQALDAASYELEVMRAEYEALKQRLHQQLLNQKASVADFSARYQMAKLRAEANKSLVQTGAVSSIDYDEATLREQQLQEQYAIEVERLQNLPILNQAELNAANARMNKAARLLALQRELADDLNVKAGVKGILQEVPLEEGEQFVVGTVLARVAGVDELKAELRVQESLVKNVAKDQTVVISAGGKQALGTVRRIDPAVKEGTVIVDVYFDGDMLEGARPDLRIDGVIQLEKLTDVLTLRRPVFSQENNRGQLFVLVDNGQRAERREVQLGRGSVDSIEVLSALTVGERVIVSDTQQYQQLSEIHFR